MIGTPASEATTKELRRFAVLLLVIAPLGAWRFTRRGVDPNVVYAVAGVIALMGVVGLVVPRLLALPYRGWMFIGHTMGRVTTPIVLTIVYLVVFTPVRLLLALFGKDPLVRRWDKSAPTYWITRTKSEFRAEDFEHLT